MSPGTFWGRPGGGANPFINPAVGAPVHGSPGGFFDMAMGMGVGGKSMSPRDEPAGYFPPVDGGYFAAGHVLGSEGVANEILRDEVATPAAEWGVGEEVGRVSESESGSGSGSNAEIPPVTGGEDEPVVGGSEQGGIENDGVDDLTRGVHVPMRTSSLSPSSRRPLVAHRNGSDPGQGVSSAHDEKAPQDESPPANC